MTTETRTETREDKLEAKQARRWRRRYIVLPLVFAAGGVPADGDPGRLPVPRRGALTAA